jgi:hypothetical protein
MNAVTEAKPLDQADVGLFKKFTVTRTDGSSAPGGKHENDQYFPLNITTDQHAMPAIAAYADSCAITQPVLAAELRAILADDVQKNSLFITVPDRTLSNGLFVPSFKIAQYPSSRSVAGTVQSTADGTPWVDINYAESIAACKSAGYNLITESQWLSVALDLSEQAANWISGVVGEGKMYQGVRKDNVDEAQSGTYEPEDADERTWLVLSTGDRIYHFAGNAYSWVRDDIQGDESGIVKSAFAAASPSITSAPAPSYTKGVGWYPDAGSDWSGRALVRGGCWGSGDYAGAFRLYLWYPDGRHDGIGFRSTK